MTLGTIREEPINVLDHGFVRLVDYMGNDLSIVRAARVSYNADWRTGEDAGKDAKLLHRLLANRHSSPFECVTFTFEFKCPIFVLRQWGRHRTQTYNDGDGIGYERYWAYSELSGRYAELEEEFYIPDPMKIGKQSTSNKQARDLSPLEVTEEVLLLNRRDYECKELLKWCQEDFNRYKILLAEGWPRELARMKLPLNTYTRLFGTVNLWNLLLWLELRLTPHAQYEIRVYAEAV